MAARDAVQGIATLEALAPFQAEGPPQDPPPLPYLRTEGNPTWDIHLEAWLKSAAMPQPHRITASNLRHLYWNIRQQVAHQNAILEW